MTGSLALVPAAIIVVLLTLVGVAIALLSPLKIVARLGTLAACLIGLAGSITFIATRDYSELSAILQRPTMSVDNSQQYGWDPVGCGAPVENDGSIGESPPIPINPGGWMSQSDYPRDTGIPIEKARVGIFVSVGPDGLHSNCEVTSSSGSNLLDEETCWQIEQNACFHPARRNGEATNGTYSSNVTWTKR